MKLTLEKENEKIELSFSDDIGYEIVDRIIILLLWVGFTQTQVDDMLSRDDEAGVV